MGLIGHEYKPGPKWRNDPPVDKSKCRAAVYNGPREGSFHQCDRQPVVDGKWCRQHDPDRRNRAEAERRREEERQLYRRMTPYREAERVQQERDIYQAAMQAIAGVGASGSVDAQERVEKWATEALRDVQALRAQWAAEDKEALK